MAQAGKGPRVDANVDHYAAKRGARRAIVVELSAAERIRVCRRRDRVEAELLAIRVDDAHQLHVEGIEDELIVAAVARYERHGGRSPWLDRSHLRRERTHLLAKVIEKPAVADGRVADRLAQLG